VRDLGETFDVGVVAPGAEELSAAEYIELGRLVEREGFHTFTIGEIAGYDAFAVLSAIAATTSRMRLGTGVIPIYTRAPVLAAMGYASLAASAPGRVIAGLGTGSHRIVEEWQGRTLDRPIETMRAYITILRAVLAGERVDVSDGPLQVKDFRLQHPLVPDVPVFIGAFKPRMLRLAGALADGVILSLWPPDQLAPLIAEVRRGAEEAGRDPDSIEVLATVHAYAGAHVDEAVERLRRVVLQYSVRPTHRPAFEATFPEIDRATELWNQGDRRAALALVPDEAVHHAFAIGDAGRTVERIEMARQAGATLPIIEPMALRRGEADAPMETVRAVAAALRASVSG
jgi:probable F420-dependent oxidoreductase